MRYCCIDCFNSRVLKKYIKENSIGGEYCHFCKKDSRFCIVPEDLEYYFRNLVELYTPIVDFMPSYFMRDYDGSNLSEKISEDWYHLFSNDFAGNIEELLESIFGSYNPVTEDGIDLESWVEDRHSWMSGYGPSEQLKEEWGAFCSEIINENRYFPTKSINLDVLNYASMLQVSFNPNKYLYRARKSNNDKKIPPSKMGSPPPDLSQNGRANPRGIPYLYLADEVETAMREVRPNSENFITVGNFKILKKLMLFDLSNPIIEDPFELGENLSYLLRLLSFFRILAYELSKPIEPDNKDLDYIPTQYLCEYLKHQGYDGLVYNSSMGQGNNVVLFNDNKVKCTRSYLYKTEFVPKKVS